ncbi:MAG: SH3 domain-containing protein [Limosilactobacillus pontis]
MGASVESTEIAVLPEGSVVKYDAFCHSGGYVWIRQPRGDG